MAGNSSDWEDVLCGPGQNFTVWENGDFGPCFEQLVIVAVTHLLHGAVSLYHYWKEYRNGVHGLIPHIITLHIRFIVSVLLVAVPLLVLLLAYVYEHYHPSVADIVTWVIRAVAWIIHSGLVWKLKRLYHVHIRGPKETAVTYLLTTIAAIIQLRSEILQVERTGKFTVDQYASITTNILHILYALTWITGKRPDLPQSGLHLQEEDALITSVQSDYATLPQTRVPDDLGVAQKNTNCLSDLLFCWVYPLMKKGYKQKIRGVEDLFRLPESLQTSTISDKFSKVYNPTCQNPPSNDDIRIAQPKTSLLRALNKAFGCEFYSIGILKFFGDSLNFAGPMLLNWLVNFMERKSEPMWHGYCYAAGLFLTTVLTALFSTHFNYLIGKVALKIRASLITTVYGKALAVSSVNLSSFSAGEIVNFMSTDTDRVVNFCPSFHAFWSLPVQVAIALYMLYLQVGISFVAGVAFAIVLIPINRWLAIKIGQLSTEMMHHKDSRVKMMNEILYGIRVIKFYAWEKHFAAKINKVRLAELKSLRGRKYLDAWCVYFWATTPVLISILTFTTYTLLGHKLTAAKVFTSMALFNLLITPLNAFPWVLNGLMEAWVSLRRISSFMQLPHTDLDQYYTRQDDPYDPHVLSIRDGHFTWKTDKQPEVENEDEEATGTLELRNINLKIKQGTLIGIIGPVGCGKSSLISAILGEVRQVRGSQSQGQGQVTLADHVREAGLGLAAQEAWLQHATVRDNILFGAPYNPRRYQAVLEACALTEDLQVLSAGDLTEIGENGVTLSGGQKARVALARAVYQDKPVYLLDDPLSAVDTHVAQHLFSQCIMGLLGEKTRLLCTHHTKYLRAADTVLVMRGGTIVAAGPPSEILDSEHIPPAASVSSKPTPAAASASGDTDTTSSQGSEDGGEGGGPGGGGGGELVQEEAMEHGSVKLAVYSVYYNAVGRCLAPTVLVALFLMQASRNITDWWLSFWVTHYNVTDSYNDTAWAHSTQSIPPGSDTEFYLAVYGGLAGANSVFTFARAFLFAYGGVCAAEVIHKQLLASILKAPISFFDVTPIGRVLNRFSSDLYSVDDSLPFVLNILLAVLYGLVGTIVVTCYGLPWFGVVLVPLGVVYYFLQNYYRFTSRELKRITSVTLSPIYAHFSETIQGLPVIRAHRHSHRFELENQCRLERNQAANFSSMAASQWLGINLQAIGVAMVTSVAFIAVLEHHFHTADQGLVGLSLSYALSATARLNGLVTNFSETEKQMVSVERTHEYSTQIPQEPDTAPLEVHPLWPSQGVVEFRDVSLRYRPDLPPALRGVSFVTRPAEKLGIVGRTGSGKSSLFLALFRMLDLDAGKIAIDDFDVTFFPREDVRSRLAIIPQDPFVFAGSVRENVDPRGWHGDAGVWGALERCRLGDVVRRLGGLGAEVGERGRHFSTGQRQLLCLARALLSKARVICVDEATASVDAGTDALIQATLRSEFPGSTVLSVAHRIASVLDCDRVLIMSEGRVAELAPPSHLLQDTGSLFYGLVHGGGEVDGRGGGPSEGTTGEKYE